MIPSSFGALLAIVYVLFSVLSALFAAKLVAAFYLLHSAMPPAVRILDEKYEKYDLIGQSVFKRFRPNHKKTDDQKKMKEARKNQKIVIAIVLIIYIAILLSYFESSIFAICIKVIHLF